MIDFSLFRQALGSASAGLRRHAGDHALGLLVGGGAALTVIAAGVAFAAFGGNGGGGGGGGGGSAGGPSTLPRAAAPQSGEGMGNGAGLPRGRGSMQPGGSDAAVAGLLQGRVPLHAPVSQPQDFRAVPDQGQQFGGAVGDRSFEAGSRPMLAMAGTRYDAISLGLSGGYGGRAKAAEASTGGTGGTGGNGDTGGTGANPDTGTDTGGGGPGGAGGSGGGNPGGSDPGSNLGGGGSGGGGTIPPDGGTKTNPLEVPVPQVPEPETYALMLTGLALLGWQARRRKVVAAKRAG